MFKKRNVIFFILLCLISVFVIKEYTVGKSPSLHSTAALLIDSSTGEVLFEKDSETAYPVASMSKLMTIYIVLEQVQKGMIDWNDLVTVSNAANDITESAAKIPVNNGTMLTVRDLFQAMVIASANNATIALAEYIAGSEEEFTRLMNTRAAELGLSSRADFVNATGLSSAGVENKMSANDISMLAHHLLRDFPEVLETTNVKHDYIESFGIDLYNTNKMLNKNDKVAYLKEVDGFKTGYTEASGFCFVGTAENGEKRLISVIINAETDEQRFDETKKLLNYGFSR